MRTITAGGRDIRPPSKLKLILCIIAIVLCMLLLTMVPPLSKNNVFSTKTVSKVPTIAGSSLKEAVSAGRVIIKSQPYRPDSQEVSVINVTHSDSPAVSPKSRQHQTVFKDSDNNLRGQACGHARHDTGCVVASAEE